MKCMNSYFIIINYARLVALKNSQKIAFASIFKNKAYKFRENKDIGIKTGSKSQAEKRKGSDTKK